MSSFLPDIRKISQLIISILILACIAGGGYLAYITIQSQFYTPEKVIQRFVSLIENPTQTVTESEKQELQSITQSGFFADWGNENNIKTLRRISQNKPITTGNISYTGESKRIAQVTLTFDNDFINSESKTAVVYMERYGTWMTGIKWQIFKIDMPREDTPLDKAAEKANEVQFNLDQSTRDLINKITGTNDNQ